jgi:hypothetical protein
MMAKAPEGDPSSVNTAGDEHAERVLPAHTAKVNWAERRRKFRRERLTG